MYQIILFFLCCFSPLFSQTTPVQERLEKAITYKEGENNRVGRIVIEGRKRTISEATWIEVKQALDYYKKEKPIFIILELNTPGGQVFAAQKISDALKEMDVQEGIPIVAFIDNWAISAGAMLAYSCRFIAVVKDGAMGAASPVIQGQGGQVQAASEKVNSAIRTDFANRAAFFDRNPLIAKAMVDKDIILVKRAGKIIELDDEGDIKSSDQIVSKKGKLLTLNAQELMDLGVADIYLPPQKLPAITEQEKQKGIWIGEKELLFTAPFFKEIPHTIVVTYQMDWKTQFLAFLSLPIVTSVLFLGLMVGGYMEFSSPGFGFPGTVALISLILILLASFALDAVHWLELILLAVGAALLAIDLFVIPSFGLMGSFGIIFMLMGLFGLMVPGIENVTFDFETGDMNAAGEYALRRIAWLCGTFLVGIAIIAGLARYVMPRFSAFQRFILEGGEETGFIAGEDPKKLPAVGATGKVAAMLRPGGKVEVEGVFYDAISSGDFINVGETVIVIRLQESTLVVEPKERR